MTTRANAYAHVRNLKRIPIFSGNESSLRYLRRGVSPIVPLLRSRQDLHTTRKTPTAVTIGRRDAGPRNITEAKDRTQCLSIPYPGARGFSATTASRFVPAAGPSDEFTQKSETSVPRDLHSFSSRFLSSRAKEVKDWEGRIPDGSTLLFKLEYFIFLMLRDGGFGVKEELARSPDSSNFKCTAVLPIKGSTEAMLATGFADSIHRARQQGMWKLFRKFRLSNIWTRLQSDATITSALGSIYPFTYEHTKNPINLIARDYIRLLQLSQRGAFQLSSTLSYQSNGSVCTVSLSMPGQRTMKATGRANKGFQFDILSEMAAHLLLMAELQREGLWLNMGNKNATNNQNNYTSKDRRNPQDYRASRDTWIPILQDKPISKDKAIPNIETIPEVEAIPEDEIISEDKVISKVKATPEVEAIQEVEATQEVEAIPDVKAVPEDKIISEDKVISEVQAIQEVKSTADGPNPKTETTSADELTDTGKSLADRGSVELTMDDDLLDMMGVFRNDLLQASKHMAAVKGKLGQSPKKFPTAPRRTIGSRTHNRYLEAELHEDLEYIRNPNLQGPEMLDIHAKVAELPIMDFKQPVLDLVNKSPFSIIVAETGSGKSTQVPQIILNDAIDQGRGSECNILCTQPRRIAASRLADRVSQERGETIGETVGYIIRLVGRRSRKTRITYCTTGILLKNLQNSPENIRTFSHIIIDEVHVRDIGIDFVMLLLKRYVQACQGQGIDVPKITVMSATVDTNLFASYFDIKGPDGLSIPAPHITIPGRQFPVKYHYLEEIMNSIESSPHAERLRELTGETESQKFLDEHFALFGEEMSKELTSPASSSADLSSPRRAVLAEEDPLLPAGLYTAAILNVLSSTESGSIVCFLAGLRHIFAVKSLLQSHGSHMGLDMSDEERFRIVILHSQLPEEQAALNLEMPIGCRRIILSTDLAEASVTIPDVKYVVDTGKVNQMTVDQKKHSHRLVSCWATMSNSKQRAGRAGRVQTGEYFYLGTKRRFDTLRPTLVPEIIRGNLQDTCLRAKAIVGQESIASFLQDTIEPPHEEHVSANVDSLKLLQALDKDENLTPLGHILSKISLPPHLAKLVVLGIIFRCLDPMLTLASTTYAGRSLFVHSTNPDHRKRILASRVQFSNGSSSDHLSTLNAFNAVRKRHFERGIFEAQTYAQEHMIWSRSYQLINSGCNQVFQQLKEEEIISTKHDSFDDEGQRGGSALNVNSHNTALIKSLLLHCFFPRLAGPKAHSNFFATDYDPRSMIQPRSVIMDGRKFPPRALTVYDTKIEETQGVPFLHENSLVSPLMAGMFGGRLIWNKQNVVMDSWLLLDINAQRAGITKAEAARNLIEVQKAVNLALNTAYGSFPCTIAQPLNPTMQRNFLESRNELFDTLSTAVISLLDRDRDPSADLPKSKTPRNVWGDSYITAKQLTASELADAERMDSSESMHV